MGMFNQKFITNNEEFITLLNQHKELFRSITEENILKLESFFNHNEIVVLIKTDDENQ